MIQKFKLIEKKNLTHNVYEMVFESEDEIVMKPGQFVTFLLDKIWWRAYSILKLDWKKITLIIKKREQEDWWRWWSKFICELNIWDELRWVWPAGHFLLRENTDNKLFIWTWVWLVPIYNMINYSLNKYPNTKIKFVFWVREEKDTFYINELKNIKEKYPNFDYDIYISRVKDLYKFQNLFPSVKIHSWYTTNNLIKENTKNYKEAYICWAPSVIKSSVEKLEELWFKEDENIFYEKF